MGFEKSIGSLPDERLAGCSGATLDGEGTHLRSVNLSRAKAPPSSGKLVLNTPFLEAGVPASMVTRKTYGVVAGGKRTYWIRIKRCER